MLSNMDYIRQSLELHLFFARIMKEHSFFLELGFTPRDSQFTETSNSFRMEFDKFLGEVISLASGVVRSDVLRSGEIVTQYTLDTEEASSFYTGIDIPTELTIAEQNLVSGDFVRMTATIEQDVYSLNERAIKLVSSLVEFKATILNNVLSCQMFTMNYPLLIDHIMREARLYVTLLERLQRRDVINMETEALEQESFWNQIMAEHAKFIRGLLDPSEEDLFNIASNFGNKFDELTKESLQAMDKTISLSQLTNESLTETMKIRDFKAQGTQGLLECNIKSIIIPLLGDHVLREANHFLRLLSSFNTQGQTNRKSAFHHS
ncbi:MAG: DUF2935 domain-containing protein [Acholeplasmataceae bacterium]|nr:DUF2935 domain-containing protein [Acholeplasmataceae bacterium]